MRRESDVQSVMIRVEATLAEAARTSGRATGVIELRSEGDREINVGRARHRADIEMDLLSGSDRALVGGLVRLAKRAARRGLRWYIWPIVDQQSRFNHASLDLIERLRQRLARASDDHHADFAARVAAYRPWFEGCQRILHVDAADVVLGDAVSSLRAVESGSADGVFASLVATPRFAPELVELLEATRRVLRSGGLLVIETTAPDYPPARLSTDGPRPIHPEAVRAAMLGTGFGDAHVEATTLLPGSHPGPNGSVGRSLAAEVERIDGLLTGRPCAVVIARGPTW